MTDDQIELEEFTCPACGSHHFGQTEIAGGSCHGYKPNGQPCNFRFAFNDRRYFKKTGKFRPRFVGGGWGRP